MAGTSGARGSGPVQGPQGKGSNSGGRPGRGAGSPRVAPQVGAMRSNVARAPIAPIVGKPGPNPSPQVK